MKNLKLNCLALAGLTAIMGGLCACDGGHSSSSITTVNIVLFNGTGGKEWVTNATKRFAEANKETSFEEGKKGINFKITQKKNVIFNTELKSSGDDIFIYESTVALSIKRPKLPFRSFRCCCTNRRQNRR